MNIKNKIKLVSQYSLHKPITDEFPLEFNSYEWYTSTMIAAFQHEQPCSTDLISC